MGLMDRDYYREKKEDRGGFPGWFRRNPLTAVALLLLLLFLIAYLVG